MTNKTIWIWGDSWAEPIWDNPLPGSDPSGHITQRLKDNNFQVKNYGKSGEDNLYSLNLCRDLSIKEHPDYIIWFHTDCFRSKSKDSRLWYIDEELDRLSKFIYKQVADFISKSNSKLIVVEGQSVVHKNNYKNFLENHVYFLIKDWRSELVNMQLPECHFISTWHHLDHNCLNSTSEKMKILDDVEIINNATANHYHFPDQGHPGNNAHKLLLEKILQIIN